MIILGIDPGSRITGYGLIKKTGNKAVHIENGSLYLDQKGTFADRLVTLYQEIQAIISAYGPQALVVENIFYHKNPKSLQKLGEVRGVVILAGAITNLKIYEYTPLEIKKAITGYGNATKEQVQYMVRNLLKLNDPAEENASDALATAICHAHSHNAVTGVDNGNKVPVKGIKEVLKKASFYR